VNEEARKAHTHMTPAHQISPPPTSPAQAAAIAAAIEQFMRATAPPASSEDERPDPWIRAAILEGVTRDPELTLPASG
jgi:hypothetical protein